MESKEITQTELNQTTSDLLLQESIQTNQKLDELQDLLISIKDMKIILPESIKNVMFEQLKKQQDLQENSLNQSKEELQKSKEQHNLQMNKIETEFNKKIEDYQHQTETQLSKLRKENQEDIVDKCTSLFKQAEKKISQVVNDTTNDFKNAAKMAEKMRENSFDFNDFIEQLDQVQSMGPLDEIMKMIPGMSEIPGAASVIFNVLDKVKPSEVRNVCILAAGCIIRHKLKYRMHNACIIL